jgi:hypothetical protein
LIAKESERNEKALVEHLEMALGVVKAMHELSNQTEIFNAADSCLEAQGLNYASIIRTMAVLEYEIDRLKTIA